MTGRPKFKEPITIYDVSFGNRLLRSSIGGRTCNYDGTVTDVGKNFEKRFAEGGVGGIVSTTFHVEKERLSPPQYPSIATKVAQMPHRGSSVRLRFNRVAAVATSCRSATWVCHVQQPFSEDDDGLSSSGTARHRVRLQQPPPCDEHEADRAIDRPSTPPRRCAVREAGADGIEIVAGKGYLIDQFLNPAINRRQDDWGGSEDARFRLLDEILKAVRGGRRKGLSRRRAPVGGRLQCQPATARGRALALTAGVHGFAARQRCRPDGALCEADAGGRLPACGGRVWLPQSARRGRSVSVQGGPQLFRLGAPPERQGRRGALHSRISRCPNGRSIG